MMDPKELRTLVLDSIHAGITVAELADRTGLTIQTVAKVLSELYFERQIDFEPTCNAMSAAMRDHAIRHNY